MNKLKLSLKEECDEIVKKYDKQIQVAIREIEHHGRSINSAKAEEESNEVEKSKLIVSCAEHKAQVEKLEDEISKIKEEPARLE